MTSRFLTKKKMYIYIDFLVFVIILQFCCNSDQIRGQKEARIGLQENIVDGCTKLALHSPWPCDQDIFVSHIEWHVFLFNNSESLGITSKCLALLVSPILYCNKRCMKSYFWRVSKKLFSGKLGCLRNKYWHILAKVPY